MWHKGKEFDMYRIKRIWYLQPMRAAKVQASLRIRAVSPEPSLLAHTSSESRGTFRQKARSLAPMNGWACAVKTCHDGMLKDKNSLDGAHIICLIPWLFYHNVPKFSDTQIWANSVGPDQTAPHHGLHCLAFCLQFLDALFYSKAFFFSNFWVITAIFWVSEFLGFLW